MTIDTSQNVGLGVTPSAWTTFGSILQGTGYALGGFSSGANVQSALFCNAFFNGSNYIYRGTAAASEYLQISGQHQWLTAPSGTAGNAITFTQAMTLDASGNLGIGTTSPSYRLTAAGASTSGSVTALAIENPSTNAASEVRQEFRAGGTTWAYLTSSYNSNSPYFAIGVNGSERARIDSSGNLLVGTTSTVNPGGITGTNSFKTSTSNRWVGAFENANATSPWGIGVSFTGTAPNGTSNAFFYGTDTGGDRFYLRSNGGLANYSANNANLSDVRTKTDIQDAGNYLAKICAIPVRTFKYKDQTDDLLNLGCIAQEVEAVAPELVDVSGFGETPEDGVPLKAIYQTDLQYALMKCIQEQQALITQLQADVAALKGAA
jgi:hypothetical protein